MILSITPENNVLPHFDNILQIHKNNKTLSQLDQFNPIYAGGYPMSLLFAPRSKRDRYKIRKGFYSDYDIYFSNQEDLDKALEYAKQQWMENNSTWRRHASENAVTYVIQANDPSFEGEANTIQIQLIKKVIDEPQDIISTFDFINCAIAFSPLKETLYFHKEIFKYHNLKELEILKPWMLDNLNEDTKQNVIIQVARFKKYCLRWDYTLANKSCKKLLEVYEKYPNLIADKAIAYTTTGGAYEGVRFIAVQNQNIWTAIAPIITINPLWYGYKDKAGIISKAIGLTEEQLSGNNAIVQENLNLLSYQDDTIPF